MSFLSWLFGFNRKSRYSNYNRYSKHGGYSKHGRHHGQYEYQNWDVNRSEQPLIQCRQCQSILNKNAKFCSECGLSV
ncbi:hypothetical protein AHYW_002229 [Providencia manganoxydans]|uniref:hypothetical protein n=1 Tax=Providencia manganoxydans TaxID=2923283 RepID=UPI0011215E16